MTIDQLQNEIFRNNDEIWELQDITLEEQIPEEERSSFVGVYWHTPEQIKRAKERIQELEARNRELDEQINYCLASRL